MFPGILLLALTFGLMPLPAQEAPKGVAAVLKPFVDKGNLAGAVTLVADKDKILSLEAVGYADVGARRPMLVDFLFWIASMNKPITGAGLMLLVDEGKVSLDDPIEKFLPEFKGLWLISEKSKDRVVLTKPKRLVTVRDVLNHTSGMPFRSAMEIPTIDVMPLRDCVRSYALTPLNSEPGTKYVYSNAGINTAGRIIEVVSGMSYEDFMQKRLFGPLGMKDTTFWPSEAQLKRLAKTYRPGKGKKGLEEMKIAHLKYPLSDRGGRYPCPGGGLFSTATDIGIFCQMVLNGGAYKGKRILSEEAVKQMTSRQTGPDIKNSYGLGWAVGDGNTGHGGAYSTNMQVDTKRGLVTVFMVQHAGFPGNGGQSLGAFRKAAEQRYGKK
ncbi:MAG: beta-lactamase family protein [Planctomycetes bacterium]|nr:beta-lactamase family protein [Planctomycetota bacterium]